VKTIVIAPHPDDEVLGVGGTLLRRKAEGAKVAWLIVTAISVESGWNEEKVKQRADEIHQVTELFGFDEVFALNFPTTQLDHLPIGDLIVEVSNAFRSFDPEEVFVPHPSDVHTDHRIAFNAVASSTKWFRYPTVKRVLAYETLSETDFGLGTEQGFRPNVFIDITPFLEDKLRAMDLYASELAACRA
jgi:LmbE family N-acetylglucosaminyl deacetylase